MHKNNWMSDLVYKSPLKVDLNFIWWCRLKKVLIKWATVIWTTDPSTYIILYSCTVQLFESDKGLLSSPGCCTWIRASCCLATWWRGSREGVRSRKGQRQRECTCLFSALPWVQGWRRSWEGWRWSSETGWRRTRTSPDWEETRVGWWDWDCCILNETVTLMNNIGKQQSACVLEWQKLEFTGNSFDTFGQ